MNLLHSQHIFRIWKQTKPITTTTDHYYHFKSKSYDDTTTVG